MSTAVAIANKQPAPPPTNGPGEDAVIAVNLGKIQSAKFRCDEAGNDLRSVLKHAESKGLHLKAAAIALKIAKAGDAEAWLEQTSAVTTYLRILRHGINDTQLVLDFIDESRAPAEERATLDGLASGRLGFNQENNNPHDLNTKAGQSWLAAFRQGRAEYDLVMTMKDDDLAGEDD